MVSLLNISILSVLLFIATIVHAKTSVESPNKPAETESPANSQQLYELYKSMRTDPRFATVSNEDIVAYLYRNYVLGNGDEDDVVKPKLRKQHRNRHRKINVDN